MHQCLNGDACNQTSTLWNGSSPLDWQCTKGYKGKLCGLCCDDNCADDSKATYGSIGLLECKPCINYTVVLVFFILSAVVLFLVVQWVVQYILKGITDRDSPRENEQASSDVRGISAGNHAQAMEAIKIMLLYVQYMVLIKSANVRWPAALNGLFMVFSWFFATTNAQAISIVCLKILLRFPAAVVRFTYVAAPIAVLLATAGVQCWVFLGVYKQARRSNSMAQQQRITLCDRLAVSCLVVLYMFFPSLVRSGLAFFACYQLDTYPEPGPEPRPTNRTLNATGSYWLHNMDLKCFTGDHWT